MFLRVIWEKNQPEVFNKILKLTSTWDRMYHLSIRLAYLSKYVDSLLLKSCSLQNIKNGDSLLSENRVVFYFRNEMYYLRWRRSSVKRGF